MFGFAAPATVVVTTPNAEHNARYPGLAPGTFRHRDHRFEWTRPQFRDWAVSVAATSSSLSGNTGLGSPFLSTARNS